MVIPAGDGNLCDAEGGVFQKIAADFHPVGIEECHWGLPQVFLENFAAFAPADIAGRCDILQLNIFRIVLMHIGNHLLLQMDVGMLRHGMLV